MTDDISDEDYTYDAPVPNAALLQKVADLEAENAALRAKIAAFPLESLRYVTQPFAPGCNDAEEGRRHWQAIDAYVQAQAVS